MRLIDYVLGPQSVQQLPPDQQDQARSEAMRRFVLGTLLGGRGVASGFASTQEVIPQMQAAQQRQRLVQAQESAMVPTGIRPGSQIDLLQQQTGEDMLDAGTVEALRRSGRGSGVQGTGLTEGQQFLRQFDPTLYAQNVATAMDPTKPKDILDVRAAAAPQFDPATGTFRDPFSGRILRSMPVSSGNIERQFNVDTQRIEARPIEGALRAQALTTLPTLGTNQEFVFNASGQPIGVRNMDGSIQALTERTTAETAAKTSQTPRIIKNALGQDVAVFDVPPALQSTGGAGAGGQNVVPQSDFDRIMSGNFGKVLEQSRVSSDIARSRVGTLDQLQLAINNPQFQTGTFADQKTGIVAALNWFGVTGENANSYLQSAQAARTGFADLTNQSIQELAGPMSDKDILFSRDRNAKVTDLRESIQFAIDVARAADAKKIQKYNFLSQNAGPNAEKQWNESPEGRQSLYESPNLRKYLPQRPIPSGPDRGKMAHKLPSGEWVVFD